MKPSVKLSTSLVAGLALATLLVNGCQWLSTPSILEAPEIFEYRYRTFEALKPLPDQMMQPISDDLLAERFIPLAALNRSMDLLSQQGFNLWKIKRVQQSQYYTLIFRRALPEGYRPTRAPMEMIGLFEAQPPAESSRYYYFSPTLEGYTVFISPSGQPIQSIQTRWNQREEQLMGQVGPVEHLFRLGRRGQTIMHIAEKLTPGKLEREVIDLRRVGQIEAGE